MYLYVYIYIYNIYMEVHIYMYCICAKAYVRTCIYVFDILLCGSAADMQDFSGK